MLVFLFDITSSGVHHRICGTSVGRASLDICNLPPLPQLGERHECTVIFYRLLKIIFQYINSDIQLDIQIYTSLKTWDFVQKKTHTKVHFWLFLLLYQCLCGGIVFVATPVAQDNTATALCVLTACINWSDGEMMLQRRAKRPMWRVYWRFARQGVRGKHKTSIMYVCTLLLPYLSRSVSMYVIHT